MVVEFFFMTKFQPHRCYLVLSVVLIIIILLSPFDTFTSNDGKVTTLSYSPEWSYWPFNRFVNCRQFMYLVISLLILRAGYGI